MNVQLLLDGIVRQTTVLIAELATAGGARAPLAHVANQVFLDLAAELERQGVSRKVSADMFGLALRSYQRKIARLRESSTDRGRSLWTAVYDFLLERGVATRAEVLRRFNRDDEELVAGVLHDLADTGILFASGRGGGAAYRVVTKDDLERLAPEDDASMDAMVWTLVYREGPAGRDELGAHGIRADALDAALERLLSAGRIAEREKDGRAVFSSSELVIRADEGSGWEAAVFDHFQALVKTVVAKLRREPGDAEWAGLIGGSTYTFVVWPEHPLHSEVCSALSEFRTKKSELRSRVDDYNAAHGIPPRHQKVVSYLGQCVISEDTDET